MRTKNFRIFVHRKRMNIFRKFATKKNSKGVIGESSDSDLHPLRYGHANGRTPSSWKRLESFRSSHNMLLMPASPTSSQLNVNSIISSQTSLFKVLLSFLGIILLKCSLIYMLKTIIYHLLNFVPYA